MVTPQKIDEWLKEVEARPDSVLLIVRFIADRLRELSARNQELLAENILLQSGEKVAEYKRRIEHLEYQLEMLKRRYAIGDDALIGLDTQPTRETSINILVYNAKGRMIKLELGPAEGSSEILPGVFTGELISSDENPRLIAVADREDLLFLFSSGRVSTHPVAEIPAVPKDAQWEFARAALPQEIHAGERLVALVPVGPLPVCDFFLQASRRGCVKKTMTSMAETILTNHFLGKGTVQKADQPFELTFGRKGMLFALVSREGNVLSLDVDGLSYAVEERIKLTATDRVVSGCVIRPGETLLVLTQTGKVLQRTFEMLKPARSPLAKGQPLIPPSRRAQGVCAIGALPVRETDQVVILHSDGKLTRHAASQLTGAGALQTDGSLLAFTSFPAPGVESNRP
jgi:DNA gyrase/topoisomerase IV subunit A